MVKPIDEVIDLKNFVSINLPFFVRKVNSREHWQGLSAPSHEERVLSAMREVFPDRDGTVSVFLAETASDLCRIAIGINSTRTILDQELYLLCVTPKALSDAGLCLTACPANTDCIFANMCHYDIIHDEKAIWNLVDSLISAEHKTGKITRPTMRRVLLHAASIGCHALETDLTQCLCEDELAERLGQIEEDH